MMEFVSWDDEIPNVGKNKKIMFQTTNQEWFTIWLTHTNNSSTKQTECCEHQKKQQLSSF